MRLSWDISGFSNASTNSAYRRQTPIGVPIGIYNAETLQEQASEENTLNIKPELGIIPCLMFLLLGGWEETHGHAWKKQDNSHLRVHTELEGCMHKFTVKLPLV